MDRGAWQATVHGVAKVRHDLATKSPSPLCPSSQWCHLTISSSVIPFSSCLQSFPASGSFPMSQLFATGGQNIGASASRSVLPNEYSVFISFRIYWFDVLVAQGTLKSLLQHHNLKASSLRCSAFFVVQLSWVQYIRVTLLLCERAGLNTVCKHLQFPLYITFLFHLCF